MPSSEASLLVRIKEEGKKALTDVSDGLKEIKTEAAIAAAAITAFIGLAVKSYADAEEATTALRDSIRNQGLDVDKLTKKYEEIAKAIQRKTTYDDDQVKSGIAVAQTYVGNLELTESLIKATVDFATKQKMDLNTAFELVGKSIGSNTNGLARHGIEVDSTGSRSEKLAQVLEGLRQKADGAAEAMAGTLSGSIKQARNEFGELLEVIGKEFAPFVMAAAEMLKELFISFQNSSTAKFTAIVLSLSAAITGLIAVLGAVVGLVPTLVAGLNVVRVSISALFGPIGLLVAALTTMYLAWETNLGKIQQITYGVFNVVSRVLSDFGNLLKAVMTYDLEGIKKAFDTVVVGLKNIKQNTIEAYREGFNERDKLVKESYEAETQKFKKEDTNRRTFKSKQDKEDLDLDKKRFEEMDDWKKLKNEARIDHELALKKQAEDDYKEMMANAVNFTTAATTSGFQGITSKLLSDFANTFLPGIGGAIGAAFDFLAQDTDKFKEQLYKLFGPEFIDNVLKNLTTLVEELPEILNRIISYLTDNMPAIVEKLVESIIQNMPKIAAAFLRAFVEMTADPRFAARLAVAIQKGFVDGIIAAAKDLTSTISKAVKDAFSVVSIAGGGGGGIGEKVGNFIKKPFGFIGGQEAVQFEQYFQRIALNKDEKESLKRSLESLRDTEEYKAYGRNYLQTFANLFAEGILGPVLGGNYDIKSLGFAHGGPIPGYAGGGLIDNRLIRATDGEFMTNKDSTSANLGLLTAINNSNGRSVGVGNTIVINVNGGLLGDRQSAEQFARAVDEELFKLRQGNASRAFDKSFY